MDSTLTDRRGAHVRVGAVATAAFLILLLVLAARGPAASDPVVPATAPAATPTPTPQQATPADPIPDDPRERGGWHRRGGGEPGFGGGDGGGAIPAPDGGGVTPAPDNGGGTTT